MQKYHYPLMVLRRWAILITMTIASSLGNSQTVDSPTPPQYTEHDLICLAKNIYYEARGEPPTGQIAVGLVTLNRYQSGEFSSSICGVVTQNRITEAGKVCQFSWVCTIGIRTKPVGDSWVSSLELAKMLLNGGHGTYADLVNGAKYFHAVNVRPGWSGRTKTAKIGNHIFYI